jgi:fructosamine-3-kinase
LDSAFPPFDGEIPPSEGELPPFTRPRSRRLHRSPARTLRLMPAWASGETGAWRTRVEESIGAIVSVRSLGTSAWMVQSGGDRFVVKAGPGCRDEAGGLRQLRLVPGAPPVPDVVLVDDALLVTTAVDEAPRSALHEEALGHTLAALHSASHPHWGGGSTWIGSCQVDASTFPNAAGFYGARLSDLAVRCGLERPVGEVVERLPDLLPGEPPALLHGDLWWGNVLFGADGGTWLIDPSVHGGYPEEDLAMLSLFGPVPERMLSAYLESRPLSDGWRRRVPLFQLYPLLVHTVLFDGSYRGQAQAACRRVTS